MCIGPREFGGVYIDFQPADRNGVGIHRSTTKTCATTDIDSQERLELLQAPPWEMGTSVPKQMLFSSVYAKGCGEDGNFGRTSGQVDFKSVQALDGPKGCPSVGPMWQRT